MPFADRDSMNYHDDVPFSNDDQPRCCMCNRIVSWSRVLDEFGEILSRVDYYGEESLTEHEQMVYHQTICSQDCFERMQDEEERYWKGGAQNDT